MICETCGVKYLGKFEPRNGCTECWDFYFKSHPGETSAAASTMRVFGKKALIAAKGKVWVKQFTRFAEKRFSRIVKPEEVSLVTP